MNQWEDDKSGIYHLTNSGTTSWHGFAQEILREQGWPALKVQPAQVEAIATSDYPTAAARPTNSVMDCQKLRSTFGISLPSWQDELRRVMASLQ